MAQPTAIRGCPAVALARMPKCGMCHATSQTALAMTVHLQVELHPSAVTTSAASRSSIVRPFLRTRYPTTPPNVIPPNSNRASVAVLGGEAVNPSRGREFARGQACVPAEKVIRGESQRIGPSRRSSIIVV
jgi:hypothetical protein